MRRSPLAQTTNESAAPRLTAADVDAELDRQISVIESVQLASSSWTAEQLRAAAERLRPALREAAVGLPHPMPERAPFVLALPRGGLPPSVGVTTLTIGTRSGGLAKAMDDIDEFRPVAGIEAPSDLYAVVDVLRGSEHRGRTPEAALAELAAEGRSPLTVTEGIALVTAHPEALEKNHCFQTPGSRAGDRRVPGLWISNRAPRLGFCWAGNHHTWLGVASCARRISAP